MYLDVGSFWARQEERGANVKVPMRCVDCALQASDAAIRLNLQPNRQGAIKVGAPQKGH